ncbi:RNA methyltransferase [bacterium]|nr:RNA methyltransferase [bacterium]
MEITSTNNELIKSYAKLQQKKYRTESGMFLLEGYKAIKEAFEYGIKIERIFVEKTHITDYSFAQKLITETNSAVLKKLSSTESAPPAVAVAYQKKYDIKQFKDFNKVILLEGIKDLGNLGTIIRSAVAFGCEGIVLYGDCADMYNPKCVRSAVGNLWKIPVCCCNNINEFKSVFNNFNKIATLPRSSNFLKTYTPSAPQLIMFGSEAEGLSKELTELSTDSIKIEMNDNVESLNLAASASVIMYELFN